MQLIGRRLTFINCTIGKLAEMELGLCCANLAHENIAWQDSCACDMYIGKLHRWRCVVLFIDFTQCATIIVLDLFSLNQTRKIRTNAESKRSKRTSASSRLSIGSDVEPDD